MKFKVGDKVVITAAGIAEDVRLGVESPKGICMVEVANALHYRLKDCQGLSQWYLEEQIDYAAEAQVIDLATMEYVARSLVAISSAAVNDTERLAAFSGYISGLLAGLKGDIPA